ncbi:MAG: Ldh family oxidoreductase [Thermodesulfobacteriota bacterium]
MEKKEALFIPVSVLRDFSVRSFRACGLSEMHAEWMSDTLIRSELRGIGSHGIVRLPFYCRRLLEKGSNPRPEIAVLSDKPAALLIDGDNGLGQIVSIRAMEMVIERARTQGVCFAGVRNSCHFGMTAYYPMMALKRDMIGMAGCNTATVMAPWGGGKSAIGNNPLAITVPTNKPYPLVLDMAMSVVSGGKIRLEAVKGTKIPLGWILDEQGRPTDDPREMFPNGTLLPMGYKGFGLAIMIEILSGVLTRAAILNEIPLWFDKLATPVNLGHFFMAFDIGAFLDPGVFKERVGVMIDELKASPPMEGSPGIVMPGEMEYLKELDYLRSGIPVSSEVVKTLDAFAKEIGLEGTLG